MANFVYPASRMNLLLNSYIFNSYIFAVELIPLVFLQKGVIFSFFILTEIFRFILTNCQASCIVYILQIPAKQQPWWRIQG